MTNFYQHYLYVPKRPEIESEKKEEKRYHHPWIQLQSLSGCSGASGGGCKPRVQGVLVVATCLVVSVLWWWVRTARGWSPLLFIPFGFLSPSFPKVLENESVGGGGESWWTHIPPPKASVQLPCRHDIGGFCKPTPCLHRVSLGLPHSLIKMRKFP